MSRGCVVALRGLGLGDLCTGVPALRGLRRAFPDHRLVLAGPRWATEVLGSCGIDRVVETRGAELTEAAIRELRGAVAVAVNLHGRGPESTRSLRRLRSPRLISFRGPHDPPWSGPEWRSNEHETVRWCRLLAQWGIDADPGDLLLEPPALRPDLPRGATIVHPGAAAPARRWPAERFARVVRHLRGIGHRVVLTGSNDEVELCRTVARRAGMDPGEADASVLAGATTTVDMAGLTGAASLVVTNDTGVAHLATAYRTPSVVLFGPTPPSEWGPPADGPHTALWCGRRGDPHGVTVDPGLLDLGVDDVLDAVGQVSAASGREVRDGGIRCS